MQQVLTDLIGYYFLLSGCISTPILAGIALMAWNSKKHEHKNRKDIEQ